MTNTKVITLFSGELEGGQRSAFSYTLNGLGKLVSGLLHSNKASVSVSFQNETQLEIDSLDTLLTSSLDLPPSQRIISWEQELADCSYISGMVQNLATHSRTINLYALIQE
ncbi:hypothetical protein NBT05_12385 [Aquimarina sp. ERC-38]|uniref:hypothetical protein n=1 Tax=Aquimarina sp. ERC-38 TaxID=2949996 RepID=UPI0022484114|nr:hypothetical protein [Aquimarina sp. ERC-38]UZO79746.1 hypothetical protein NBT05_12385 [Aquimarina sp. ERC-38]